MGWATSSGDWGHHDNRSTTHSLQEPPAEWAYLIYPVDFSLYTRTYFSEEKATPLPIFKLGCLSQPKCLSANEWIQKLWYIYTMEFYAAERKRELLSFTAAWMELESIMLSEISQAMKDKYHMISPISGT